MEIPYHCLICVQYFHLHNVTFLSVCNFLSAGVAQQSREKLEFKHRLSIALGAAKGDPLVNQ